MKLYLKLLLVEILRWTAILSPIVLTIVLTLTGVHVVKAFLISICVMILASAALGFVLAKDIVLDQEEDIQKWS